MRLVIGGLLPETHGGDARRLARRVEASLPGVVTEPPALYAAVMIEARATRARGTCADAAHTAPGAF